MTRVDDDTIDLVVTSPPYPMIGMWDVQFAAADPRIGDALATEDAERAFTLMHACLNAVWRECLRVLRPGGIACINVGDATRTIGGEFRLFSNHSYVLRAMTALGFSVLPDILWRKPTNAPSKFLGSGMLPAGAYVTYEHEYILIFRKPGTRLFEQAQQKDLRRRSAFFWEERNVWFSDLWTDLTGKKQRLSGNIETRIRSAGFPLELPYRLIQMHSLIGDTILDPFLGTGTTAAAALSCGRSSVGFEIEATLIKPIRGAIETAVPLGVRMAQHRLEEHMSFVAACETAGRPCRHLNRPYGIPVMTGQEVDLELIVPCHVNVENGATTFVATHEPATHPPIPVPSGKNPRDQERQ